MTSASAQPRILYSSWAPANDDPRPAATAQDLDHAADLLRHRRVLALTGAGISTDSGIPDYRGPNATPRSPMTYQQFVADPGFRRHYWARNHVGWRQLAATRPNAGHHALARLEHAGVLTGVITQNVDRLHQEAGSHTVIDLHGSYAEIVCLDCRRTLTREAMHERLTALNPTFLGGDVDLADIETAPDADAVIATTEHFRVAPCPDCGGILKPNIVYFGENVPPERVARTEEMVDDAAALLVAGTTLAVRSGLRLAKRAAADGKPVIIVNRGQTRADDLATLCLNAGTSQALTHLAGALT